MFNRLIIAVLTLGLLLTFTGVAFSSDPDVTPIDGINPIARINPDAPKFQDVKVYQQAENLERPSATLHPAEAPSKILPPTYYCSPIDYAQGNAVYYWLMPDDGGYPVEEYAMIMTPDPGYICSVKTVSVAIDPDDFGGTPGMRITLRDGSYNLLAYQDFAYGDLPTTASYVTADFSTANGGSAFTFFDGENFVIGAQPIDDGLGVPDTLAIFSGDLQSVASHQRMYLGDPYFGWYRWSWSGGTEWIDFLMVADVCYSRIPYSSCYTLDYNCNAYYSWTQPDSYGDDYFNMRFSVDGPETLTEIGVAFDDYYTVGTPDVDFYVWDDDGTGFPGSVMPGFPVTIPYASIQWFPDYTTYTLPTPLVFRNDFHVGWSTNDADPSWVLAVVSDDASCGTLRSSESWAGSWGSMLGDWGYDVNFLIYAQLCRDEFSTCTWLSDICTIAYYMSVPSTSRTAVYEQFKPLGLGCRLEEADFVLYDNADPLQYLLNTNANVFASDGSNTGGATGLPGTLLNTTLLTPADYVYYPGYTTVDYTGLPDGGVIFDQPLWVGLEPLAPVGEGINILTDDYTCGGVTSVENYGEYKYTEDLYGVPITFYFEIYVCCVPTPERTCLTDPVAIAAENWPTYGKDFGRSNAAVVSIGDNAQGTLTKAWQYDGSEFGNLNSAVIYNDTVVNVFLDNVVAVDLNSGAEIWKNDDPSGLIIGGGMYCTPTIFNLDAYGEARTVVLVAGGDAKAFSALNLTDGSVYWTRNFLAHGNKFMTWGYSVVVECDGAPVVIYNNDDGDIYAVPVIADGNPTQAVYTGWTTNPMNYGGIVYKGITYGADVDLVFIGTGGTNANVTAIDPCTGEAQWDLVTTAGLQMENLDPESFDDGSFEEFTGGISYDPPSEDFPEATLYFASYYSPNGETFYYSGGIVYSVDAATGDLNWATLGIAADYCAVALDGLHIINNGWSPWVTGYGIQKGPTAFAKEDGTELYTRTTRNPGQDVFFLADGMLSCEIEAPDWYVGGIRKDFLEFYESDFPGINRFHRRFITDGGYEYAHHYQPSMVDQHLLFCYMNKLICFTPQADRQRLDVPRYRINVPVPFGLPDPYTVIFPDPSDPLGLPGAIGNLGSAPLTIDSIVLSDTTNGTIPADAGDPGGAPLAIVDPTLTDNMEKLASKFASNVDQFRATISDELGIADIANGVRTSRHNAAFAIPSWVYTSTLAPTPGTVIPAASDPSDSTANYIPITLDVDGTSVPRGFNGFYCFVYSDDPDYFVDSARMDVPKAATSYAVPCIQLGIVGGCLYEDVEMTFGETDQNFAHIWNATRLADGDITSIEIDGDGASFWQGSFIFGTSGTFTPPGKWAQFSQRLAHWASNWSSAYAMNWESILPDVNCLSGLCPPQHTTNALVGSISDDGTSYRDVFGEIVTFAFIDSVQDFCLRDTLGNCTSWDWLYAQSDHEGVQPPYSGPWTMGFKGCATVISAYEEPRLNNFFLEKFEFNGRYGAVDNVFMGGMIDYDINYNNGHKQQVAGYDADISTAWAYTCNNNNNGWGFVKIPFDCCNGYAPMRNAKTLAAGQSSWNDSMIWLDSAYYWMTLTGLSHQTGTDPVICATDADDRDFFFTVGEIDMPAPGDDPAVLAVAVFGLPSLPGNANEAEAYKQLALTADKWCGFYRGDVDDDGDIDVYDVAALIDFVCHGGPGPYPFMYLGDVNCDGNIDNDDAMYLLKFVFQYDPVSGMGGTYPPPCGAWEL
jgi:hypothetical protein